MTAQDATHRGRFGAASFNRARRALGVIAVGIALAGAGGCNVPASHLQTWPGYPIIQNFNNFSHWLVVKCALNDDPNTRYLPSSLNPAIKDLDTYINLFLTLGGVGTGNLIDYYRDVTYGSLDLQTRVYGWYTAPFGSNDYTSPTQRNIRVEKCAEAISPADAANIDFTQYQGVLIVLNKPVGAGACYTGSQSLTIKGRSYNLGCVVLDPNGLYTAFASHEMGHGLDLSHSWDTTPCEYCDQFDVMSALNTWQFFWPNYPPQGAETGQGSGTGPGLNLPNLLHLNALPPNRVATYTIGSPVQTFTLTALSHPSSSSPLGVKIVGSDPNDIYTVEYRQGDGWDQGIPLDVVLIHEYKANAAPFSYLQEGPAVPNGGKSGGWVAGGLYVNRAARILIFVQNIDAASGTATVSVNSYSG
jgi:hypothetical protein